MATSRPSAIEPSAMRVRLHLKPGQQGTRRLLAEYRNRLVCVRYRYDPERGKRFKTIALRVAERDWSPPRPTPSADQIVPVRVAFAELARARQVKQGGATWNPERTVWEPRCDRAVARPGGPDRAGCQVRARPEHLMVDASRERPEHLPADAGGHPDVDAGIYRWMLASGGRGRASQSNSS